MSSQAEDMANFNWHMSIKPVDVALLLRKRAMDDPLFPAVSCSPDITISLVLKYPVAKWNIEALSYNRAISVRDKLDNPRARWTIMNLDDETVPLDVVRQTSHMSPPAFLDGIGGLCSPLPMRSPRAWIGSIFPPVQQERWASLGQNVSSV
jgi:hypothetical protein